MVTLIQESFGKGVIGPALYGRVDVSLYKSALRQALNAIIRPYGGVYKRQGTRYIANVKDHSYAPRPIPFQYADDDQYMLEFGDHYIRFIRDDGLVLSGSTIAVGTSPGFIAGSPLVQVETAAAHGLSNGNEIGFSGVPVTNGWANALLGRQFKVAVLSSTRISLKDQASGVDVTTAAAGVSGGIAGGGATLALMYEIVTPWAKEDLPLLKYVQNKDVMTLTHPNYPIYELRRLGHTNWTLTTPTFEPGQEYPTDEFATAVTTGAVTYKYQVTAVQDDTLVESIPGIARDFSRNVTAITNANPGVFTSVAHGFTNGQVLQVQGTDMSSGGTPLDGRILAAANVTTDTFTMGTLSLVGYSAYDGSGGLAYRCITDIDLTNPVRITLPSHGYSENDEVEISYTGHAELDGNRFSIQNVTTNTFDLVGIDGTTFVGSTTSGTTGSLATCSTGDRSALITVTSNIVFVGGTLDNLVDGSLAASTAGGLDWPGAGATAAANGDFIQFQFRGRKRITGATFTSSISPSLGTWQLQGSDDGVSGWIRYAEVEWTGTTFSFAVGVLPPSDGHTFWRFVKTVGNAGTYPTGYLLEADWVINGAGGRANRTYTQVTNGNATAKNTISWDAVAGAGSYNVYKFDNGVFGFIGSTENLSFTDDNILATSTDTPPRERQPFDDGEYPAAVGYTNQRRVFGGSNQDPETSEYSKVGGTSDFSKSAPLKDDDAITATLVADQLQKIRHYVSLQDLLILTNSGEWRVNSGPDSAFSAKTIKQKQQTNWGSSHLKPVIVGNIVFFVEPNSARVRSIGYQFNSDAYDGNDMSLLAYHYFSANYIEAMAFGWSRDQRLYCVRDDGKVVCMTFHKDQEVVAWSEFNTQGVFRDVGALRTVQQGAGDGIYFIVRRRIGSNYVHYWEKYEHNEVTNARDQYYVDCGASYDDPVAITNISLANPLVITAPAHGFNDGDEVDFSDIIWETQYDTDYTASQPDQLNGHRYFVINKTTDTFQISLTSGGSAINGAAYIPWVWKGNVRKAITSITGGLWHLEGKTVRALCDGNIVDGLVVTNGAIAALNGTNKYSRVHIGLGYVTDIELLDMTVDAGVSEGHSRTVTRVTLQLENSRFPKVSNSEGVLQLSGPNGIELPTGIELYTGQVRITLGSQWNWHGRILLRHADPTAFNLCYVADDVQFDDPSN